MSSQEIFSPASQDQALSTSDHFVLKANIKEFYQKIRYIAHLENNGQITTQEAYQQIKFFWKQLKTSKKLLKTNAKNLRE